MTASYDAKPALYIAGEWRGLDGREAIDVVDPATAEAIGAVPAATAQDLDDALESARAGFLEWRDTPVDERAAILRRAAVLMRERAPEIGRLMTLEQGKPLVESVSEAAGAAGMFEWAAEEAKRTYGRVLIRPAGQRSLVIKQPVGPVAAFSPWNFPVYLMAKKLAPALASGCSVISKPPEETPACTNALAQCLIDAGLPAGALQVVYGVPDTISRHLLSSDVIRKLSFTGSVPVGKHLMKLAADGLKRVTMELGGHAPVLIFADCDLEKTLDMVVPQKFRNAGQVCVSPTRFFVEESIHDRFVNGFAERTKQVAMGHGIQQGTTMGPLANVRRPDAIEHLVDDAIAKGARVMAGGRSGDTGYFFEPTLLADVPDAAEIMSNEPFGPVAVTQPFATLDEALGKANSLPYGLAAFAFTDSLKTANLVGDRIEAGMVGINSFAISVPDSPFGGIKDSGFGSEGGVEGFDSYMVTKAIHQA